MSLLTNKIKEIPFTDFPLIGEGNSAKIYRIPETDIALKIFANWPTTEFGLRRQSADGLKQLYSALTAAEAPLLHQTEVVSIVENLSYKEGMYPFGVSMQYVPNLEMGLRSSWFNPSVPTNYLRLLGRLHSQGIIVSPRELELGRHRGNQAFCHIPAIVNSQITLVDWTNFSLVEQVIAFDRMPNTEFSRQLLLGRDTTHTYSFGPLFDPKFKDAKKIYLDSLFEHSEDKDFVMRYEQDFL